MAATKATTKSKPETTLPKAPKALTNYLDQHGDLPSDVLLGRFVFYKITDEPVDRADMVEWFEELELNPDRLPAENKAQHAFEKATSETTGKQYEMTKGRTAHLLCRDVAKNREVTRRQITREIKDTKNRVLDYDKVMELAFYRPNDAGDQTTARMSIQIDSAHLERGEKVNLQEQAESIQQRYYRHFMFMDGAKLRACVRDYLKKELKAIEVRAGVYFVLSKYDDELARLSEMVNRFGGGCEMNAVPIVDVPRERKFLGQVLQREQAQALNDLAKAIEEANPSQGMVRSLTAKFEELQATTAEHAATLKMTETTNAASVEHIQNLLVKLQDKALES
jgi:hypothetical protein